MRTSFRKGINLQIRVDNGTPVEGKSRQYDSSQASSSSFLGWGWFLIHVLPPVV
jgi:hypothetical protein